MTCPYCKTESAPGAVKCAACASWMVEYPPVREWYRARDGKLIAGVCRGLANRFGVPVAALRLAFLLSLFLGGGGLVVYIALWIAMPIPARPKLATIATPPAPPSPPASTPQPPAAPA